MKPNKNFSHKFLAKLLWKSCAESTTHDFNSFNKQSIIPYEIYIYIYIYLSVYNKVLLFWFYITLKLNKFAIKMDLNNF